MKRLIVLFLAVCLLCGCAAKETQTPETTATAATEAAPETVPAETYPVVSNTAAEQIACFLRAFHRLSVPGLPAVCAEENRAAWQDFLVRLRKKVLPLLPPKAASAVADRFTTFLSDPHSFSYTPVLTHRDLGCSNLLYDSGTNRLCGVIDFGQSGFDDPALDLASLICPASFGKEFAPILLKYWPEAETFLPRAEFYIWTFPLQEALFGAENGDDAALQSGIAPFLSEKG